VAARLAGTETFGFKVPVLGYDILPETFTPRFRHMPEAAIGKNKFGATLLRASSGEGDKKPDSVLVLLDVEPPGLQSRDVSVETSLRQECVYSSCTYYIDGLDYFACLATVPIGTKFFVTIRYRAAKNEMAERHDQEDEEPLREVRGVVVVKSQDQILAGTEDLSRYVNDDEDIDWKE
jgi:hypothetical protein